DAPLAPQPARSRTPPLPRGERLMARPHVQAPWRRRSRAAAPTTPAPFVPVDPRAALAGPLDPDLLAIRRLLQPFGRRLWLRRVVRRAWVVLAAVVFAELALWTLARFMPLEVAPTIAATFPVLGLLVLLALAVVSRPSLGEAAIAVDREGGLGDRAASALALAVAYPDVAGIEVTSLMDTGSVVADEATRLD